MTHEDRKWLTSLSERVTTLESQVRALQRGKTELVGAVLQGLEDLRTEVKEAVKTGHAPKKSNGLDDRQMTWGDWKTILAYTVAVATTTAIICSYIFK